MPRKKQMSLLLVDDSSDLVRHYKKRIERHAGFRVTVETDSVRARSLAEKQLFDTVVIYAKLDYRGFEFGGLRLADDLRSRYGHNSIIVISRYITAYLARANEIGCDFMEKYSGERTKSFERDLCQKLRQMQRQQYVFLAMPFGRAFSPAYRHIRTAVIEAGLKCIRVDKVPHNRPMQEVIFELVEKSKLVVFLADDANPNAYYEAGFADALHKEVIIVVRAVDELKFDVSNRHAIIHENKLASMASQLRKKIIALRLAKPIVL